MGTMFLLLFSACAYLEKNLTGGFKQGAKLTITNNNKNRNHNVRDLSVPESSVADTHESFKQRSYKHSPVCLPASAHMWRCQQDAAESRRLHAPIRPLAGCHGSVSADQPGDVSVQRSWCLIQMPCGDAAERLPGDSEQRFISALSALRCLLFPSR